MVRPCSGKGRRKITQNSIEVDAETKESTKKTEKNWIEDIRKAMNERNLSEGQWKDRKQWSLGVGQRRKAFWNRYMNGIGKDLEGSGRNLHLPEEINKNLRLYSRSSAWIRSNRHRNKVWSKRICSETPSWNFYSPWASFVRGGLSSHLKHWM